MKKVLYVTVEYPGLGGERAFNHVKYLSSQGYLPVVLTNKSSRGQPEKSPFLKAQEKVEVIRAVSLRKSPFRIFSRLFKAQRLADYCDRFFFLPDFYATWVPSAVTRGCGILRGGGIEAIITSSPPESVHLVGAILSKIFNVKWIADYRDLWTTKQITCKPATRLHGAIIMGLEKLCYRAADRIIANTNGNARIYIEKFGIPSKKVVVITNGYDQAEIELTAFRAAGQCRKLRIGYMGYFDKPGFPWREFLSGLRSLREAYGDPQVELHICGYMSPAAVSYIRNVGLIQYVHHHGILSHSEALEIMRKCNLLLVLMYENEYSKNIVPHKVYYYIGMRTRILSISETDGELADIIRETNCGTVVSAKDTVSVFRVMNNIYQELLAKGVLAVTPNEAVVCRYEMKRLVGVLADTLACASLG